ncbi:hypothetical protein MASR1M60_14860 [Rhodocyclaceae bacterium]
MLLEEIHILSRIQVGTVDLFLIGRRIWERNQFDRLDDHETPRHMIGKTMVAIVRLGMNRLKQKEGRKNPVI